MKYMDGVSQRNYKTKIKNGDRTILAVSAAINCQNMVIFWAINCQNMAISGAINSQKGQQILYRRWNWCEVRERDSKDHHLCLGGERKVFCCESKTGKGGVNLCKVMQH